MRSDFPNENLMNKHLSPAGKRASLFPGAEQTEKPLKRWLPRLKWKAAGFTGLSTDTTVSFAYAHLSHTTATHLSAIQCSFLPGCHLLFPLKSLLLTNTNPKGIQLVLCKIICMTVKLNAKLARLVSGIK